MPSPVNNTQYVVFTNLFCLSFFNSHSQTNYKYSFSHHYVPKLFYKIFCWHWESIFIFTSFSSVNIASDLINVSKCNICKYALSKTIGSRFIFVVVLICLHLYLGIHQKIMFRRYSTYSGKNFLEIQIATIVYHFHFLYYSSCKSALKKPLCPKWTTQIGSYSQQGFMLQLFFLLPRNFMFAV